MKWQLFIGHLIFIGSVLVTASIVLTTKLLRQRQRRRSPLHGKQIGHVPGQQLLDRIEDEDTEAGYGVDIMMVALPLLALIWATLRIDWEKVRFGSGELIFLIAWTLTFAYGARKYHLHAKKREQARDGLLAERVTGMQLNRLVAHGCVVLHDVPFGDYNIDHVVIAPRGVYAVETKSFRKPKNLPAGTIAKVGFDGELLTFNDFSTRKPVEQARRQAKSLAAFLRESLGESFPVDPAIALPGWWVDKTEAGKLSNTFVFTPMGRGCDWFTYGSEVIPPMHRALIAKALATRYPAVEDYFGRRG